MPAKRLCQSLTRLRTSRFQGTRLKRSPAEVAADLDGCILCGRNPIVVTGMVLPTDAASLTMILTLRTTPVPHGESPTLGYGLCEQHAVDTQRSTALVHAKLLEAAASVVTQ